MGACQMSWREGEGACACADGKPRETNGQGKEQMRQQARGAGLRRFIFYYTARVSLTELRQGVRQARCASGRVGLAAARQPTANANAHAPRASRPARAAVYPAL